MSFPPSGTSMFLHTPGKSGKANPSDVRKNNRSLIFSLLFPANQYSRAELGRRTKLSRVAVSDVVNGMLDEGLIHENGYETETVGKGKRGTLLSIDPKRLRIISLDLSQAHLVQGAVTDLLGTPLFHSEIALSSEDNARIDTIITLIEQLRTHASSIIGIGIAATGVVQGGVIRRSTELGWQDFDLQTPLESRFDLPVTITNDVVSSMLTERFFGQGESNMIFVKIGPGIGSATLIDDEVILGQNHAGGEIGHISVDPDGPLCKCGKRGCLELSLSVTSLRNRLEGKTNEKRKQILQHAGEQFASALAMPIGLLDMTDVCVYGPPDIVNTVFCTAAQHYADRTTTSTFRRRTTIRRCQCGPDIALQGASLSVLYDYLER